MLYCYDLLEAGNYWWYCTNTDLNILVLFDDVEK